MQPLILFDNITHFHDRIKKVMLMEIYILASGSKGNVTYFETNHKRFLIDAGITFQI